MQENIEQLDDLSNLNDMGSVQNLNDRDGMDGLEWYFSMNKQRVKVKENYFWEFLSEINLDLRQVLFCRRAGNLIL